MCGTPNCRIAGAAETGDQRLDFMVDVERAPCITVDLLVGYFVGKIELITPFSGVPSDHVLQRAILSESREERLAKAAR